MKSTYLRHCTFVCSLFFIFSCSTENSLDVIDETTSPIETNLSATAAVFLDVSYGSHNQQTYDIYLPEARSINTTKVLVLVHGGSWYAGDKSTLQHYITSLQNTNPEYAIVNMNYVTAEAGSVYAFPGQFLDIQSVINSVAQNSFDYEIMPEFGLIGASAGGQLALMYDYVFDAFNNVKMVCTITGPTNFDHPFFTERPDFYDLLELLVDPTVYPLIENNLNLLSPVNYVTANTSPTIMFYGNSDPKVPVDNAYDLQNILNANGVPSSLTVFEGGHGDWTVSNRLVLDLKLSNFIYTHL